MGIFDRRAAVELWAKTIQNPVERLRYLRGAGISAPLEPATARDWWRRAVGHWLPLTAILVVTTTLISGVAAWRALWRVIEKPASFGTIILPAPILGPPTPIAAADSVWLVDQRADAEIYSNGLRIETRFAVSNTPRGRFLVYSRDPADPPHPIFRDKPAGIVFHTTESRLAPFAAQENLDLKRIGAGVLSFVQQNRSYHYVIDRFGRVFRVVQESDIAWHAGNSVWAEGDAVYVNLNDSFLGVAFETQTRHDGDQPLATPAQILAARQLTEMLRARYGIPASSCVTHAQVSVNPSNLLIGYHTDWAANFPFAEIGLPGNYAQAPPSLTVFGFDYDPRFVQSTGARMLPGLLLAEAQVASGAERLHLTTAVYKAILRNYYKKINAAAPSPQAAKETEQ